MSDLSQRLRLPTIGAVVSAAERAARRFPLVLAHTMIARCRPRSVGGARSTAV